MGNRVVVVQANLRTSKSDRMTFMDVSFAQNLCVIVALVSNQKMIKFLHKIS